MADNKKPETPMMKQFRLIKEQYPDAMLLFRCGDFYETYADDAIQAAKILNITLTHRSTSNSAGRIEMAGFPYHALDTYLPKLVRAGRRVAICDQLEDPKTTKTLVKRGVTELVTPAVSYSDTTLQGKENNFLAAVALPPTNKKNLLTGVAFLDISTGEFLVAQGNNEYIAKLITNLAPKEVLHERGRRQEFEQLFSARYFTYELEDWMMTIDSAVDRLNKQFGTTNLKGFGIDNMHSAVIAAGSIMHYLDMTQHLQTSHIDTISRIEEDKYMWLDRFTVRNLELTDTQEGGRSLLSVLDNTLTPMGARMLRKWISLPLKDVKNIRIRQQVVEQFFRNPEQAEQLTTWLPQVGDIERLATKVATGRIQPRETLQIAYSLNAINEIKNICSEIDNEQLKALCDKLNPLSQLAKRIINTIVPNASTNSKTDYIRDGVDADLDELRAIQRDGKQYLFKLQQEEAEKTGIQSLKIGYNNVFGYYLEVRNTFKDKVPPSWIRKQTLAQAERYITDELKQYEEKILTAEERTVVIEQNIFTALINSIATQVPVLVENAHAIAQIDCLYNFAVVAKNNKYICPEVNDSLVIDIHNGRHPVIELQLPIGEKYVANDVMLDNNSQQVIMLTGPNMAGKSALLRQTALIVLMAQIGSFIPAESASIGIVDKIFTRVGASDNISIGESTFMVEMNEAAAILNNISERSLILFDELGRGTSTYDGISIAWAIVEYIHQHKGQPKTLFATHYHELNEMEKSFTRIRNYNVSVKEVNGKVIFLRKLAKGGSEHSFGIHVAKIAGMPPSIIKRAEKILKELENANNNNQIGKPTEQIGKSRDGLQLSFFQLDDPVLEVVREEIKNIDINNLTPLEALNKLSEIKKAVLGKS